MIGNRFTFQLILRIGLIAVLSALTSYLWFRMGSYYFLIPSGLVIIQIYGLIHYINRTNRKMAFLFESIRNEDFSVRFDENSGPASLRELHTRLNALNQMVRENFIRNEEQEKYYRRILDQLKSGVLIYNRQGHIRIANPAASKLLDCEPLHHIRQLDRSAPGLSSVLSDTIGMGRKLFELTTERETIQLVIEFSQISLRDDILTLVTIQNIYSELDQKETDSWIKLIRVLTHEIMNSISPITSISETLIQYFKHTGTDDVKLMEVGEDQIVNTIRGLEVIRTQGNDLMNFVQSYRHFLHIPDPDKKIIRIRELFEKVRLLVGQESVQEAVLTPESFIDWKFQIAEYESEIFADEKQITRILVNLIKNAFQSMEGIPHPSLRLTYDQDETGRKYIEVEDNGPGIEKELRDQIFIPFFTTKEKGTGIGLSLSKKIMQMHGGNLTLIHSDPFVRTVFRLIF